MVMQIDRSRPREGQRRDRRGRGRSSSGEIVAVATPISDPYHDVALHWAVAVMILVLAWAAWRPDWLSMVVRHCFSAAGRRIRRWAAADFPDGPRGAQVHGGPADPRSGCRCAWP